MKKILLSMVIACMAIPTFSQTPVYLDDSQPIEARVQDALSRMTLKEKVRLSYAQSKFSSPGVPRLGIPELWMSDGPHGVRMEINWNDWGHSNWTNDSITAFPALTALAATWNPDLSGAYGKAVASVKKMTADGSLEITVNVKNTGNVAGKFKAYIGSSSTDIRTIVPFELE